MLSFLVWPKVITLSDFYCSVTHRGTFVLYAKVLVKIYLTCHNYTWSILSSSFDIDIFFNECFDIERTTEVSDPTTDFRQSDRIDGFSKRLHPSSTATMESKHSGSSDFGFFLSTFFFCFDISSDFLLLTFFFDEPFVDSDVVEVTCFLLRRRNCDAACFLSICKKSF